MTEIALPVLINQFIKIEEWWKWKKVRWKMEGEIRWTWQHIHFTPWWWVEMKFMDRNYSQMCFVLPSNSTQSNKQRHYRGIYVHIEVPYTCTEHKQQKWVLFVCEGSCFAFVSVDWNEKRQRHFIKCLCSASTYTVSSAVPVVEQRCLSAVKAVGFSVPLYSGITVYV